MAASKRNKQRLGNWVKRCARKYRKFKCSPAGKNSQKSWRGYMKNHCGNV
jgi:hypothetical protein